MEKSSTPACLGFCGRAKLLRPAGVDVVLASGEVQFRVAASLEPLFERLEGRGKCKSRHAAKGSGEAGGSNYGQGVEDWEANFNDQGREEAERREAKCGRVFVEGREDTKCIGDCGGNAQEEGNVDEEGSAEEGGGVEEEGFGDQQPNTYEAERNKRVANVQERLQLLLSAKCSMWVGLTSGFFVFLGCGCCLFPFTRTGTMACGQRSPAQSHPPVLLQTLNPNT